MGPDDRKNTESCLKLKKTGESKMLQGARELEYKRLKGLWGIQEF